MKRVVVAVSFVAALTTAVAAVGRAQSHPEPAKHEWDYGPEHGPEHWGEIKPEFAACRVGQHQSPIDIRSTVKAELPGIRFDYRPCPLRIVDNGHTIQVNYAPGSSILVGEHRYDLKQFHFHHPSEERIQGRGYELSLHLVHADAKGRLAVVAVLLETGKENPLVLDLWRHLPREKEHEEAAPGVTINAADLLPAARGYYTFEGSLTTPPCSESVTWLVLKQAATVSQDEVARFAELYANDARPTQPQNDRVVQETR